MNELAVLAELGRLYLITRELEAALEQARAEKCPDPDTHPKPTKPAEEARRCP